MQLRFLGLMGILSLAALGCSASYDGAIDSNAGTGDGEGESGAGDYGTGTTATHTDGTEAPVDSPGQGEGFLTAGDFDDNLNFEFFQGYVLHQQSGGPYQVDYSTADRVTIRVTTEQGEPVSNAKVQVVAGQSTIFSGPTGSDGRLLFFPGHDGAGVEAITLKITPPPGQAGAGPLSVAAPAGNDWQITLPGATHEPMSAIDIAFVIDTTGSMGDEIVYLQDEIQDIVADVEQKFAGVSLRFALIVYRDEGDAYVVKHFDFTDSVAVFEADLDAHGADGGGDFPEAMDQALERIPQLGWRTGDVARMAVLVADAPPHEEHAQATVDAFDPLRGLGIKLYPVAASGVDPRAEFLMRLGAQATGGRYMFLTDDSGIGGAHMEPTIPCYQVRKLTDVLVYQIASELSGERAPVPDEQVIREVGDPEGGVCTLDDGSELFLW